MSYRVAVVDDDASIVDLLRVLLESEGYSVRTFSSGQAALAAFVVEPPDAAIVDLMMPAMDGVELLRALRRNSVTRQLPVLICSAYYENLIENKDELTQTGVALLRKPFHVQQMLETVARMIAAARDKQKEQKSRSRKKLPTGSGRPDRFAA